jgi:hypothetical protein
MEREEASGLILSERRLSAPALRNLIARGGYESVTLNTVRPDLNLKRALVIVLAKYFPGVRSDGSVLCLVTDLQGNIAQLVLCGQTRNQLSPQNEGDLVLLLQPQLAVDLSKGYTLKFTIQNQQDVVVIGTCKYFSRYTGQRKDGKPCTVPVDTSVGLRCKYHQNPTPETPKQRVLEQPKPPIPPASESEKTKATTNLDSFLEALQQAPKNTRSLQSLTAKTSSSFGGFDLVDDQEALGVPSRVSIPAPSKIFSRSLSSAPGHLPVSPIVPNSAPRTTNSILNASMPAPKPLPTPTLESRWKISSQSALESQRQRDREQSKKARTDSLVALGNSDHSVILSISSLQSNSKGGPDSQSRKRSRGEIATPSSAGGGKLSQKEIDDLLNRQSVNEKQAKDEWTDGFVTRLKALEKREELIYKDEEVTSMLVKASHCLTCDRYSENSTGLSLCQQKGHKIALVSTKKRFFECQGCGRRDFVLGGKENTTVGPSHPCGFCKQVKWRPCGKNRSGAIVAGSRLAKSAESRESGLVVSLSSETSRRDRDRITALHSSLDFTAR